LNDFDYLAQLPGEEREQDWIRKRLGTLSVREGIVLAAATLDNSPENTVDAINCLQPLDYYTVLLNAGSYEALGRRYLLNETRMPMDALPFADLEQTGRYYEGIFPGLFVGDCYVEYPNPDLYPAYSGHGAPLPADDGWSVKLKLASPAVPEGVWLRLPGPLEDGCEDAAEKLAALRELQVKRWDECALVDAKCVLPEAGDLMAQYSDNVSDLLYDGVELGYVLAQKGQGSPHFMERYAAALALEGCHDLRLALDISQNLNCYDWMQRADLEESGRRKLLDVGVTEEQIRASVNANLKMSIFAETECHFSAVSIVVYTALIHSLTCWLEARQALIYQLVLGLTGENGKYNYSRAVHLYPPFFDITCSAKNYKIAPALTVAHTVCITGKHL
jgi:hypothetical protein